MLLAGLSLSALLLLARLVLAALLRVALLLLPARILLLVRHWDVLHGFNKPPISRRLTRQAWRSSYRGDRKFRQSADKSREKSTQSARLCRNSCQFIRPAMSTRQSRLPRRVRLLRLDWGF